jgi:hypothetical protein
MMRSLHVLKRVTSNSRNKLDLIKNILKNLKKTLDKGFGSAYYYFHKQSAPQKRPLFASTPKSSRSIVGLNLDSENGFLKFMVPFLPLIMCNYDLKLHNDWSLKARPSFEAKLLDLRIHLGGRFLLSSITKYYALRPRLVDAANPWGLRWRDWRADPSCSSMNFDDSRQWSLPMIVIVREVGNGPSQLHKVLAYETTSNSHRARRALSRVQSQEFRPPRRLFIPGRRALRRS